MTHDNFLAETKVCGNQAVFSPADYQRALVDFNSEIEAEGSSYALIDAWVKIETINAIRSALTLAASDTHVWVPRNLTPEMFRAAYDSLDENGVRSFIAHWDAMITAVEGK